MAPYELRLNHSGELDHRPARRIVLMVGLRFAYDVGSNNYNGNRRSLLQNTVRLIPELYYLGFIFRFPHGLVVTISRVAAPEEVEFKPFPCPLIYSIFQVHDRTAAVNTLSFNKKLKENMNEKIWGG